MEKVFTATTTIEMQAILIEQIILDDSGFLTCWGQGQRNNVWYSCDFVTTYEVLNTMLRYSQEKHDEVQMAIVKKLENMTDVPALINLEAELGAAVIFDNMIFQVKKFPHPQHAYTANYAAEACYYIERVLPLPVVSSLAAYSINKMGTIESMEQCIQLLHEAYELYLGFIEIELEEPAARLKAGLENDKQFSMAYYAWQLHT